MAPAKLTAARGRTKSRGRKLGPKQRTAIVRRRLKGESAASLAEEFGVTRQYVGLLVGAPGQIRRSQGTPPAETCDSSPDRDSSLGPS